MVAATRSASASVVIATRWRGVVASVMKATGSVGVAARRAQACGDRADPAQRHVEHQHIGAARQRGPVEIAGSSPLASWPVTKATLCASPRCVTGMPAAAARRCRR